MPDQPAPSTDDALVEIYTADHCPYCRRAEALLDDKGVGYTEHEIRWGVFGLQKDETFEEMVRRSGGRRTVPQVFIGGHHVGGSDDLAALDAAGELDRMLGRRSTLDARR